ncbi:MAG: MerR family transcriptional regulator [Candidatus Omnitrophica bacterium]|nr:MerR family transcriptional regulator [Candidatus Omnitrophota bacterium]
MSLLSPKEVLKKYSLSYQTLNFYTTLGLFTVVERRGNKRLYDENEIRDRIGQIQTLKNQGYPLKLIINKLNNAEI